MLLVSCLFQMEILKNWFSSISLAGYTVEKQTIFSIDPACCSVHSASKGKLKASAVLSSEDNQSLRIQSQLLRKLEDIGFIKVLEAYQKMQKKAGFIIEYCESNLQQALIRGDVLQVQFKLIVIKCLQTYQAMQEKGLLAWGLTLKNILKTPEQWKFINASCSVEKSKCSPLQEKQSKAKQNNSVIQLLHQAQACAKCPAIKQISRQIAKQIQLKDLNSSQLLQHKMFKEREFAVLILLQEAKRRAQGRQQFLQKLIGNIGSLNGLIKEKLVLPALLKIAKEQPNAYRVSMLGIAQIARTQKLNEQLFENKVLPLFSCKVQNLNTLLTQTLCLDLLIIYQNNKQSKVALQVLYKKLSDCQHKVIQSTLFRKSLQIVNYLNPITIQKVLIKKSVNLLLNQQLSVDEFKDCLLIFTQLVKQVNLVKFQLFYLNFQKIAKRSFIQSLQKLLLDLVLLLLGKEDLTGLLKLYRKVIPVLLQLFALQGTGVFGKQIEILLKSLNSRILREFKIEQTIVQQGKPQIQIRQFVIPQVKAKPPLNDWKKVSSQIIDLAQQPVANELRSCDRRQQNDIINQKPSLQSKVKQQKIIAQPKFITKVEEIQARPQSKPELQASYAVQNKQKQKQIQLINVAMANQQLSDLVRQPQAFKGKKKKKIVSKIKKLDQQQESQQLDKYPITPQAQILPIAESVSADQLNTFRMQKSLPIDSEQADLPSTAIEQPKHSSPNLQDCSFQPLIQKRKIVELASQPIQNEAFQKTVIQNPDSEIIQYTIVLNDQQIHQRQQNPAEIAICQSQNTNSPAKHEDQQSPHQFNLSVQPAQPAQNQKVLININKNINQSLQVESLRVPEVQVKFQQKFPEEPKTTAASPAKAKKNKKKLAVANKFLEQDQN